MEINISCPQFSLFVVHRSGIHGACAAHSTFTHTNSLKDACIKCLVNFTLNLGLKAGVAKVSVKHS